MIDKVKKILANHLKPQADYEIDNLAQQIDQLYADNPDEPKSDILFCPKMNECGYKHNCSHAKEHLFSEELCRGFAYKMCLCIKPDRPKIVCLCGSTRFTEQMLLKQWELTKQGYVVLSWCALPGSYFSGEDKTHVGDQEGVKEIVDEVHKRKIDLADEIFVINKNAYIGESTRSEIDYAKRLGKPIKYLEEVR